jgi:hypothetical protein
MKDNSDQPCAQPICRHPREDHLQLVGRREAPAPRPVRRRSSGGAHPAILPSPSQHVCHGQRHCLVSPVSPYSLHRFPRSRCLTRV